ncbi:tRNA-binding protein [Candidatus Neomarinimicrobiota bacterium]
MKPEIDITAFKKIDIRIGTITEAVPAPGLKVPAYRLTVDFGPLGTKISSARITDHYKPSDLVGRQVAAVVNFPPKQIGKFVSEVLVLGGYEESGAVRLLAPDQPIKNGSRLR